MVDVSENSEIKSDELNVLLKLVAPDIEKIAHRLLEAIKAYAYLEGASSELITAAQTRCEEAFDWISAVADRCGKEQLHLSAEQPSRKADFEPFCDGSSISIYEFFGKFEAWSRGVLTPASMAHVLYTQYLDPSVVNENKELEVNRESYVQLKRWQRNLHASRLTESTEVIIPTQ
jgi:hypothetical protein